MKISFNSMILGASIFAALVASATAQCAGSETNICMSVNVFSSETGYYELDRGTYETLEGPSPDITVKIGDVITFDQSDITNWYHPVGFAYRPDGAHGDDWGADENAEVEAAGQLQYYIDGEIPTCADAGDTGLDCYEPEFFYPRNVWVEKSYKATLTITEEVAAAAVGGVLYYFCHIHSKMSGKIIISDWTDDGTTEVELYTPVEREEFDISCGTTVMRDYETGGENDCGIAFFGGEEDTDFEKCLQAIDCQMKTEMQVETVADGTDNVVTFMQQMIPHHINAINMAKLVLKMSSQEERDAVEDFESILYSIINVQNFQNHLMRNYLNPGGNYYGDGRGGDTDVTDDENTDDGDGDGDGGDASVCFSPTATANVNGKGRVMMKDLVNGDSVLTMDGSYQTMYSMNHYHRTEQTNFVQIKTNLESEQPLELSPNHLLYLADSTTPVAASTVEVGEKVWTIAGGKEIVEINMVTRDGLYNPLTMDGTIVVDGIAASAYTTPTGKTYLEIDGVWSKMMKSLSFHDALHMVSAPYRQFCNTVSLDLCNLHVKESAASSFMKSFYFSFLSHQNNFVKFIIASSYVLVFGTLANMTYFKVWILLANASAFFTIISKMTRTKKATAKTISA